MKLNPETKTRFVHISQIQIFKFYTGPSSLYTNKNPNHFTPAIDYYYQGHCVDLFFLDEIRENHSCHQKYKSILDAVQGTKGNWQNIEEYGCKWGNTKGRAKLFSSIDCGCDPKGPYTHQNLRKTKL